MGQRCMYERKLDIQEASGCFSVTPDVSDNIFIFVKYLKTFLQILELALFPKEKVQQRHCLVCNKRYTKVLKSNWYLDLT